MSRQLLRTARKLATARELVSGTRLSIPPLYKRNYEEALRLLGEVEEAVRAEAGRPPTARERRES